MSDDGYRDDVQDALRAKYEAEARHEQANADLAEMQLKRARRDREFAEAADLEHHMYRLTGVIDNEATGFVREHFTRWSRLAPGCDVHLILNSPGGSVWAGMELFDEIIALRDNGHKVTITVRGIAASMASVLLQAADVRRIGREAYLLIHAPSGWGGETLGEIEDADARLKLINKRILGVYADRCAGSAAEKPFTRAQIAAGYKRKDWTLDSAECLAGGLVDEIA